MTSDAAVPLAHQSDRADQGALPRLMRAWLLTGVSDGLFASASALAFGSTPARVFQGVASTLLGASALTGGARTAAIGVLMHFGVAFGWSAVFLGMHDRSARVRGAVASRFGVLKVAAVFGPSVWLVMSLAVIPLLVQRPPTITARWWVQLVGHAVFVGLPIVWSISRAASPAELETRA